MKFLGNVLATVVGIFVFCMVAFFSILFIAAIFGGSSDGVDVRSDSVIELDLSKVSNDYAGKFNYKDLDYFDAGHDGLTDVLNAIDAAKTDDHIKGLSILNDKSIIGLAQIQALRKALIDFKKSGKFVMAYGNYFTQKEYYLNCVADKIYLNPVGELEFKGLSSEVMFFKDFQEKYGIKMEIIRHGKYKSAVEPFLENKMSEANRVQISTLLRSVWNTVVADISKSRKIPVAKLDLIASTLAARTPKMAKSSHLVDEVAYEDTYHDDLRKLLKVDKDEDYHKISILDYARNIATTSNNHLASDKIAVIYAQGEIGAGEGGVNEVGEGSMRRSLQEARKDDNVKAIVLRVDSPGGNALTSDLIWREIEITKKVKPVVVSMGNLAASGGYYIACNGTKIFAETTTITGSIGVFGMLPNFNGLTSKMGIHTEQVSTHNNAADYSLFRPMDDKFRIYAQESVERVYNTFVSRVATGRKMTYAQVDAIAQGRVWSGSDAIKIGLVDKVGGMDDAVKYAAALVKVSDYRMVSFPTYEQSFQDLLSNMGIPFVKTRESMLREEIGAENYRIIEQIKKVQSKHGVQAALPYELSIN